MKLKQNQIAEKSGLHVSTISNILNGWRRPSWKNAKRLADATCTSPYLWLEGTPEDIRQALATDPNQN